MLCTALLDVINRLHSFLTNLCLNRGCNCLRVLLEDVVKCFITGLGAVWRASLNVPGTELNFCWLHFTSIGISSSSIWPWFVANPTTMWPINKSQNFGPNVGDLWRSFYDILCKRHVHNVSNVQFTIQIAERDHSGMTLLSFFFRLSKLHDEKVVGLWKCMFWWSFRVWDVENCSTGKRTWGGEWKFG